jgi:acetyl esterase/lipase
MTRSPDEVLTYKAIEGGSLQLHLFRPRGVSGPRPAMVFFFGGGWVQGSPGQFFPHCAHLADLGMVAMSAEYRVQSRHGTGPRECVQDGRSALRWIRRHAEELGIDPDRLAAGGGSAGGQVAAATGTLPGMDEPGEDLTVSCRPNALVLFNPVLNNGPEGWGHERVQDFWREISPAHQVGPHTPPTLLQVGDRDHILPVDILHDFQRRMLEAGGRCELRVYADKGHGFFNYAQSDMYQATVAEMDHFLASLGFIERSGSGE